MKKTARAALAAALLFFAAPCDAQRRGDRRRIKLDPDHERTLEAFKRKHPPLHAARNESNSFDPSWARPSADVEVQSTRLVMLKAHCEKTCASEYPAGKEWGRSGSGTPPVPDRGARAAGASCKACLLEAVAQEQHLLSTALDVNLGCRLEDGLSLATACFITTSAPLKDEDPASVLQHARNAFLAAMLSSRCTYAHRSTAGDGAFGMKSGCLTLDDATDGRAGAKGAGAGAAPAEGSVAHVRGRALRSRLPWQECDALVGGGGICEISPSAFRGNWRERHDVELSHSVLRPMLRAKLRLARREGGAADIGWLDHAVGDGGQYPSSATVASIVVVLDESMLRTETGRAQYLHRLTGLAAAAKAVREKWHDSAFEPAVLRWHFHVVLDGISMDDHDEHQVVERKLLGDVGVPVSYHSPPDSAAALVSTLSDADALLCGASTACHMAAAFLRTEEKYSQFAIDDEQSTPEDDEAKLLMVAAMASLYPPESVRTADRHLADGDRAPGRPPAAATAPDREDGGALRFLDGDWDDVGYDVDGRPTIFVKVASYRDWQCPHTVEQVFRYAEFPERVFVGIAEQNAPEVGDAPCDAAPLPCQDEPQQFMCRPDVRERIRIVRLHARNATGPVLARHLGERLYRGETFVFQIDAHCEMVAGWDTDIVEQWSKLGNEYAVLSNYPTDSGTATGVQAVDGEHHALKGSTTPFMCNSDFEGRDETGYYLRHGAQPDLPAPFVGVAASPVLQPFWGAGLSFSRGHFILRVPYDPHLPMLFQGEEILITLRGWTSGYDFYTPHHSSLFHAYKRKNAPATFWEHADEHKGDFPRSMARVMHITKLDTPRTQDFPRDELDRYGLGEKRKLADFFRIFGIDTRLRIVNPGICPFTTSGDLHRLLHPRLAPRGKGINYEDPALAEVDWAAAFEASCTREYCKGKLRRYREVRRKDLGESGLQAQRKTQTERLLEHYARPPPVLPPSDAPSLAERVGGMQSYLAQLHTQLMALAEPTAKAAWDTFYQLTARTLIAEDRARGGALWAPVRRDDSIFVSVAAYRDENCPAMLRDMYAKAKDASRVRVGLVQQLCRSDCKSGVLEGGKVEDTGPDVNCAESFCGSVDGREHCAQGRLRVLTLNESESLGPTMARYFASRLWDGETYYMQLDAHMDFARHWDEMLLDDFRLLPTTRAVISHYPPGAQSIGTDGDSLGFGVRMCNAQIRKEDNYVVRIGASVKYDGGPEPPERPCYAPYVAAGFFAAPSEFLAHVPFDPLTPWLFIGEEIALSARFWTWGYDTFAPRRNIVGHLYYRRHLPKFWESVNRLFRSPPFHNRLHEIVTQRVKYLVGYPSSAFDADTPDTVYAHQDLYGTGPFRLLGDFLSQAGLHLGERTTDGDIPWCAKCHAPPLVNPPSPGRAAYPVAPLAAPEPIFRGTAQCHDTRADCPALAARGKCESGGVQISRGQCKYSCGVCNEHLGTPDDSVNEACMDLYPTHCPEWASWAVSECDRNPNFMRVACRKSCNACLPPAARGCEDVWPQCKDWAEHGLCVTTKRNIKLFRDRDCAKTCDACEENQAIAQAAIQSAIDIRKRLEETKAMLAEAPPPPTGHGDPPSVHLLRDMALDDPCELLPEALAYEEQNGKGWGIRGGLPLVNAIEVSAESEGADADLLCISYSYEKKHGDAIAAQRDTWARKCDGFFVASTVTDPRYAAVKVDHEGPEAYDNIWQKVRSIWRLAYRHYALTFDWFAIGGDDLFLIVENVKAYLASSEIVQASEGGEKPMFLGRRFFPPWTPTTFNSGGSGYILNRAALSVLARGIDDPRCRPHATTFSEDVMVAECLRHFGVVPYDTRDGAGRERWHPFTPANHVMFKVSQQAPDWYVMYSPGLRTGLDCCATSSVAFHYVDPLHMRVLYHQLYCRRGDEAAEVLSA